MPVLLVVSVPVLLLEVPWLCSTVDPGTEQLSHSEVEPATDHLSHSEVGPGTDHLSHYEVELGTDCLCLGLIIFALD